MDKLVISDSLGKHFQISAGNAIVKISNKQFAELSEQIFEYWRISLEQVAEQSSAEDVVAHFNKLKEGEE
jgi:hypothetical protein